MRLPPIEAFTLPSIDLFALLGIVFIVVLLIVLFFIPTEKTKGKAFKKRRVKSDQQGKDWRAVSLQLEKHIYGLRREIETEQNRVKGMERDLLVQKEKYKHLQEKLDQERQWQKKDREDQNRKGQEIAQLKQDLKKSEQSLTKEHGLRLKRERELKQSQEHAQDADQKRHELEVQLARAKTDYKDLQEQITVLRLENNQLKRKHDEATFVAKSDYERLEKKLKATERELYDFKQRIQREMR